MFTIVKNPELLEYRREAWEPRPEIINHRDKSKPKRWTEKTKNEDATYKQLRQHRDALLESEILYKKTIKELQKEKEELVGIYEPTYNENKVLKSILEHGPDAVKMKKLQKARRELGEEVETLKDKNKKLTEEMQEMMKKHAPARDYVLEKSWKDVLAEGKKKKEKENKVTQGPFPGKEVQINKNLLENVSIKDDDAYDLQLDTVEKEIQILLNNVKYIKKQKEKLDYAILMEKGAIVRNSVLENAIYDKLDEDLKAFKSNLMSAKRKHDDIKQKMTEKVKDEEKRRRNETKEKVEKQTVATETSMIDHKTSETQTETKCEVEVKPTEQNYLKPDKKKYIQHQTSRAVQTDIPNAENNRMTNQETEKYLNLYQNKRTKLRQAIDRPSQRFSKTKVRTEYAKKLVVRRVESPNRVASTNQVPKQVGGDQSQVKETKHNKQNTQIPRKHQDLSSYKDKHEKRLPELPNVRTTEEQTRKKFRKSRFQSKSVDFLNEQQDILDYNDKIMNSETSMINLSVENHKVKAQNNYTKSKLKSRSQINVSLVESPSKQAQRKHKIPTDHYTKRKITNSPVLEDINSWKSERDSPEYDDNNIHASKSVKEFNFVVTKKNSHVYYSGELETEGNEKRDETAYDRVLVDLQTRQRQSAQNIDQDFKRTVQHFREHKDTVRQKQKVSKHKSERFLPDIFPNAPIRFLTDGRTVNEREVKGRREVI